LYSSTLTSPSIDSQAEVGRVYGVTGNASNKVTTLLESLGYGAMPSHSLGGVIDYTKLGYLAGLGCIGRHGLLIEPTAGSNHRLGAVFTNISNLDEYFDNTNEHMWIQDFCAKCGKCIRKCPVDAINQEPSTNENGYTTCIDYKMCGVEFGDKYGCNICVAVCPFTTVGYEKIKKSFLKEG
jgi:epoxyqueuosine reductase